MKTLNQYFEFPLTATYNVIHDKKGNRVIDVRSWGYLTGRGGGLALDSEVASEIQDGWAIEIEVPLAPTATANRMTAAIPMGIRFLLTYLDTRYDQ